MMFSVSVLVHLRMLLQLKSCVALKMEVKITVLFTWLHHLLDFKQSVTSSMSETPAQFRIPSLRRIFLIQVTDLPAELVTSY